MTHKISCVIIPYKNHWPDFQIIESNTCAAVTLPNLSNVIFKLYQCFFSDHFINYYGLTTRQTF